MKRRTLLQATPSFAFPFLLPSKVWANPPSRRLAHASIGVGGMQGGNDLGAIAASGLVEMVALCDVDAGHLNKAAEAHPGARKFQDYRELLSALGDKIDSVNIALPDHMHATIALAAIASKKHVYCQKPLAHTVAEARQMKLASVKAGIVTQMGNQIQSDSTYRTAVKMVRDGVIGKIKEVRCWVNSAFHHNGRPEGADPIPEGFLWDQWLGVAPTRPYKNGIYHPVQWRGWQDFGGGTLGDFCCHIMDTPFKALDLTAPISITAEAPKEWAENPKLNREVWPSWESITYEFPGTAFTADKTLKLTWSDNDKRPSTEGVPLDAGRELPPSGALFLGETGALLLPHVARPQLLPYAADKAYRQTLVPGNPQEHYTKFVQTCLGLPDAQTTSNWNYAAPLAETGLLGLIALHFPGQRLAWNAEAMEFLNHPAATALVKPSYREGWGK
jgi:predicted dehydrogenase